MENWQSSIVHFVTLFQDCNVMFMTYHLWWHDSKFQLASQKLEIHRKFHLLSFKVLQYYFYTLFLHVSNSTKIFINVSLQIFNFINSQCLLMYWQSSNMNMMNNDSHHVHRNFMNFYFFYQLSHWFHPHLLS